MYFFRVLPYLFLNASGIVLSIMSLEGQMFMWPNFKYMKLIHVITIRLTVGVDTLSKWARWSSWNSCCCEDNKRYFGLENSRFNFTVSLVLHFHLDSSDDSDNYLENLTACELQNKSNCQSKKWNLITPKPTRTIAWRVTQSVFCPFPPSHTGR